MLILIFLVIGVGSVALWVWGLVDAASRPEWVFQRGGSNKVMWIVLIAVLGAIAAIVYLLSVRPRLAAVQESSLHLGWAGAAAWPSGPGTDPNGALFTLGATGVPAGWYGDPSGRHHMRYWNGISWTGSAWDGGPVITDPL